MRLHEAAEHAPRPYLQERIIPRRRRARSPPARSAPARRAAAGAARRGRSLSKRRLVAEKNGGSGAAPARSPRARPRSGASAGSTSGEWKAPLTASGTTRLAPAAAAAVGERLEAGRRCRSRRPGRGVVVRRPDAVDAGAEPVDDLVGEAEHGGHAAGRALGGGEHRLAAPPHQAQRRARTRAPRWRPGRSSRRGCGRGRRRSAAPRAAGCGRCRPRRRAGPAACRSVRPSGSAGPSRRGPRGRSRALREASAKVRRISGSAAARSQPMPTACDPWPGNMRTSFCTELPEPPTAPTS